MGKKCKVCLLTIFKSSFFILWGKKKKICLEIKRNKTNFVLKNKK